MKRKGDWMQTHSGIQFWPLDPRPEDILIEDIAHALSNQCRFAGHCCFHYSVAQHSVLVSENVPAQDAMWGLLHDAGEAYLVDLPRLRSSTIPNWGISIAIWSGKSWAVSRRNLILATARHQ